METTLTEAAVKNLSASATLDGWPAWNWKRANSAPSNAATKYARLQAQPSIDAFQFAASQGAPASQGPGKVNSADKLYLVIESVRLDTKPSGFHCSGSC